MIPAQTSIETKPFAPELSTAAPTDLFAPAPTAAQAHWSTQSQPLPRDGLQAVGFATTARR